MTELATGRMPRSAFLQDVRLSNLTIHRDLVENNRDGFRIY